MGGDLYYIIGTAVYYTRNKVPICSILRVKNSLPKILQYQNNMDLDLIFFDSVRLKKLYEEAFF